VINPIQFILAWFGYVKIPIEVVQISMAQERAFQIIIDKFESNGHKLIGYRKALEAQKSMTAFLRSGRLISTT